MSQSSHHWEVLAVASPSSLTSYANSLLGERCAVIVLSYTKGKHIPRLYHLSFQNRPPGSGRCHVDDRWVPRGQVFLSQVRTTITSLLPISSRGWNTIGPCFTNKMKF